MLISASQTINRSCGQKYPIQSKFLPNRKLNLHHEDGHGRLGLERYIHRKFKERYHADIDHFLPKILSLTSDGRYSAAVGIKSADWGDLFLEQYLDKPIEDELSTLSNQAVPRRHIIEIGNLVSSHRGSSQFIFLFLAEILHRLKRDWVVFTATREVEKALKKMSFSPFSLGEALPDRLQGSLGKWGQYYLSRPQVMAGHIPTGIAAIRKNRMACEVLDDFEDELEKITVDWSRSDVKSHC